VSFTFEIGVKRLHTITLDDTCILMKANTSNKTGGLDIFRIRLSRRKPGFKPPWDYQNDSGGWPIAAAPFVVSVVEKILKTVIDEA
jgi:hypothetical protein